jgi:hypothetical protein
MRRSNARLRAVTEHMLSLDVLELLHRVHQASLMQSQKTRTEKSQLALSDRRKIMP